MPLPVNKPLNYQRVYGSAASIANGTVSIAAPFVGRVIQVGVTPSAATATATATVTTDIAGVAINGGVLSVPSASPAGVAIAAAVSATCNENDPIDFVITGGATGGTNLNCWADVRMGTN